MNRATLWCSIMGTLAELLADGQPRTGAELAPLFVGMAQGHQRATLGRFVALGWLDRLPPRRGEPAYRFTYRLGGNDSWRRGEVAVLANHLDPVDYVHKAVATLGYSLQLRQRRGARADRRQAERMAEGARELAVALLVRGLDNDPDLRAALVPAGGRR